MLKTFGKFALLELNWLIFYLNCGLNHQCTLYCNILFNAILNKIVYNQTLETPSTFHTRALYLAAGIS